MASRPRIYFFGDLHGQFQHVLNIVNRDAPDAIILLGDLEPTQPLDVVLGPILNKTIVRFIHGNHDTDSWSNYHNVFSSPSAAWNLHGRVEEVCGIRIAGLGGVFRRRIWMPPAAPLYESHEAYWRELNAARPAREQKLRYCVTSAQEREHVSSIFRSTVQEMAAQEADILVTHEAPSCHRYGFPEIDRLARNMGVRVVYHGHHHRTVRYVRHWNAMQFRTYGVGLHGVLPLRLDDLIPLAKVA